MEEMTKVNQSDLKLVRLNTRTAVFMDGCGIEYLATKRVANQILEGSATVLFSIEKRYLRNGIEHRPRMLATPSPF